MANGVIFQDRFYCTWVIQRNVYLKHEHYLLESVYIIIIYHTGSLTDNVYYYRQDKFV